MGRLVLRCFVVAAALTAATEAQPEAALCGGKWFLANYPNHVIGEAPDYCNKEYRSNVPLDCQETCTQHNGAIATGARFVCNQGTGWGCQGRSRCVDGTPEDGFDFPIRVPGGADTHCMTMVYDVDRDRKPDIVSCVEPGVIKYISDAANNGWTGSTSPSYGNIYGVPWQQMPVADLGWDFAHAFNDDCYLKDCTHGDILTCVTGNSNTNSALGSGCLTGAGSGASGELALQCYCETPCADPPSLPPPPTPPPPPPVACKELMEDGAACGPANNDNVCRNCCSGVTATCGTDDGSGPWCGADNLPQFSLAKLEPNSTRCREILVTFQPPQCFVDPETCHQHCMALPTGYNINDDDDPFVAQSKARTYRMACQWDPKMCESRC